MRLRRIYRVLLFAGMTHFWGCNPEVKVDGDDIAETAAELCKKALETNVVLCAACTDPDEFPGIECNEAAQARACGWDKLDTNGDGQVTITFGGDVR